MTDDELQNRLRRLAARPEADWDGMAAAVRDGYERQRRQQRRRRWSASLGGGLLAAAAALALWLHGHHGARMPSAEPMETFHVFEDLEPGEMIEELSPAEIDRVAKAFNKGA